MAPQPLTAERLAEVREQLALELGSTGEWRSRIQSNYPEDKRNTEAAETLVCLEKSVDEIPDELLSRYDALWQNDEEGYNMGMDWSERTRRIGFHTDPSSAKELVEEFVEEWEAKLAPQQEPEPKPRRRAIRS